MVKQEYYRKVVTLLTLLLVKENDMPDYDTIMAAMDDSMSAEEFVDDFYQSL